VTEDGVTASGCGAENAWEIRAVRYSPDGDEVIPSNAKNHECVFGTSCGMPAVYVNLKERADRNARIELTK